jgi:hypothetical protein
MAFSLFLMNNHIGSNGCLFILDRAQAFRSASHFRLASVDCTVIRAEERPLKYYSQCLFLAAFNQRIADFSSADSPHKKKGKQTKSVSSEPLGRK